MIAQLSKNPHPEHRCLNQQRGFGSTFFISPAIKTISAIEPGALDLPRSGFADLFVKEAAFFTRVFSPQASLRHE
jgi:hypothetical protein